MNDKFGLNLKEPYHIINLCFAGIFLLIFIYSGIFSAEKKKPSNKIGLRQYG